MMSTLVSTCIAGFQLGTSIVENETKFSSCIQSASNERTPSAIVVFASASPVGNSNFNYDLSKERAEAISAQLQKQFPNAYLTSVAGGENPDQGASVKVTFVFPDESKKTVIENTGTQIEDSENIAALGGSLGSAENQNFGGSRSATGPKFVETEKSNFPRMRLALRGGGDHYRNRLTLYPSTGMELSWVPNLRQNGETNGLRLELGVQGHILARNKFADLYNVYGLGGAGYYFGPLAVGARGIGGVFWNASTEKSADGGIELRLGYEGERVSVFSHAGLSGAFTSVGLDFGLIY
jgi:hypothetical protein